MAPRDNVARHDNPTCGIVMLRKLDARGCDKTKPRGFLTSLGPADGLRLTHAAHRFAHGRKRSVIRQTESIFPFRQTWNARRICVYPMCAITNLGRPKMAY